MYELTAHCGRMHYDKVWKIFRRLTFVNTKLTLMIIYYIYNCGCQCRDYHFYIQSSITPNKFSLVFPTPLYGVPRNLCFASVSLTLLQSSQKRNPTLSKYLLSHCLISSPKSKHLLCNDILYRNIFEICIYCRVAKIELINVCTLFLS